MLLIYFFYITALHIAAINENFEIVNILLSYEKIQIFPNAFKKCKKIKEINIKPLIQKIGDNAFEDCCSLQKLKIPSLSQI